MAADEALLESAHAGVASLRFYEWDVPTLSLGYFQPAALRRADARLADLSWLRRPSGGGAIVHHHELTYALALPAGADWQPRDLHWPALFHQIVAAALTRLGVAVAGATVETGRGQFLCFHHQTIGDLVCRGHKVVGSAQRRRQGALLQHGSILLAASEAAPSLPGIAELSNCRPKVGELVAAIISEFETGAGHACVGGAWTTGELSRIEEIAKSRYLSAAWNERR